MQLFNTNKYQVTEHKRDWDGAKYDSAWDDGSAFPQNQEETSTTVESFIDDETVSPQNQNQIPQNQKETSTVVESFDDDETSFPQNQNQIPQNQEETSTTVETFDDDSSAFPQNQNQIPQNQKNPKEEYPKEPQFLSLKAISLWQPYCSLISLGLKHYETRSWKTNYRGKLLICSTSCNPKHYQKYLEIKDELQLPLWDEISFPHGCAIALCDLVDCIPITPSFITQQSATEMLCGDWQVGRYAWKLKNIRPITEPFAVKGKQRLFNISLDTQASLPKELTESIKHKKFTNKPKPSDCWYSPPHIVELINLVLGEIDLDPCADEGRHIPSRNHYTIESDGLKQQWKGRVYMNPPYSCPGRWMAKLQAEFAAGRVIEAIALVSAATDTNWLSPILETQPVCFWKGRIKFLDVDYQPKLSARQSHVLIYWGDNPLHFKEVFKNHGVVNLPECVTLACFQESVGLRKESKLPGEISPPSSLSKLTPMPKKFYSSTSPTLPSTTISKPFPPELESTSFTQWAFPVSAQVLQETKADLTTPNQVSGLKPCDASPKADPNLSLSKTLLGLSNKDFEQFLADSEWSDIVGTIHNSYRLRNSGQRTKGKGFLSLPTPTTYPKGSGKCRPAGATRLEQSLRKFIAPGDKLHPAVPGWMMGFPVGWVEDVLMDIGQARYQQLSLIPECPPARPNAENPSTSTPVRSVPSKPRSPSEESSTSTKKRPASGWLEKYVKNKKLKSGDIKTFPKIEGIHRDPQEATHWYWAYKYEEKNPKAKSANGFITRAVSVPNNKVYFVRYAIASGQSVSEILELIKSGKV